MRVERKAIIFVTKYEKNQGRKVELVSYSRDSKHAGYDLISKRGNNIRKIEVKGTTRERGIPDLYGSEIRKGRLVATHLYVVCIIPRKKKQLFIIQRSDLKPKDFTKKIGYRISSTFKTKILPTKKAL